MNWFACNEVQTSRAFLISTRNSVFRVLINNCVLLRDDNREEKSITRNNFLQIANFLNDIDK